MTDQPIPQDATDVLQAFLEASDRKDIEEMKTYVSRQTIESGSMNADGAEGMAYVLGEPAWEGENVVIPMRATPTDEAPVGAPEMEMQCVMIQEDGGWKFDLMETMTRLLGGDVGAMMDQMADMMKDTMEGLGDAMASGLESAFGGGGGGGADGSGEQGDSSGDDDGPNLRLT